MVLEYREANKFDLEKINNLLIDYSSQYIPAFSKEERLSEVNDIENQNKFCLLAIDNDIIIGYLVWGKYDKDKNYAYVFNLLVRSEYRRKGISKKLREIVFFEMKKNDFVGVYFTTWGNNKAMIKLSKTLGMEIVKSYLDEGFRGKGEKTYLFKKNF